MTKAFALVILLHLLLVCLVFGQLPKCLSYEPAEVAVSGIVERGTFPGLPNYESIVKGDKPEVCWILKLETAVCVEGDSINESETDVDRSEMFSTRSCLTSAPCSSMVVI